ncbi:MAG TPA: hypothetical protein VK142_03430, partial [Bacillota bacterium]|nr:hypothetical protein [Bacillota bacterium]
MFWWGGACFILIIILLLFLKVNVVLQYTYSQNKGDFIHVTIYVYHMRIFQTDINPLESSHQHPIWKDWKNKSFLERMKSIPAGLKAMLNQVSGKYKRVHPLLQKIRIKKLVWETD